ncbi:MAG: hypothetical protein CMJ94_00960 [Planctomycetes bacterium]|nr:hypothetical protein [Planctomycetota bacterium]
MKASVLNRKLHRWGSILTALPLLVVIITGIILQLKKDWSWVQPPTAKSADPALELSFDEILASASGVPEAEIGSWEDVDRLDVRPDKGVVKVRANNRYEVQIDTKSGEILHVAYRRSDLIESLHDGSWFSDGAKLWIFLPTAIILFGLWVTGIYLWFLPHLVRRRKRKAQ